jgi:hypothetical protein
MMLTMADAKVMITQLGESSRAGWTSPPSGAMPA